MKASLHKKFGFVSLANHARSDYSRHIAGGIPPPGNSKFPPEIWQREKFGQLILMRIIEIVATTYQILRLKCTKFDFGSRWGAYSAFTHPLTAFQGPISREREADEGKSRGGEKKGKGWEVPSAILIPRM